MSGGGGGGHVTFIATFPSKACSKRRATAVPNSNEFGLAVA